jgi:hypothetical protein
MQASVNPHLDGGVEARRHQPNLGDPLHLGDPVRVLLVEVDVVLGGGGRVVGGCLDQGERDEQQTDDSGWVDGVVGERSQGMLVELASDMPLHESAGMDAQCQQIERLGRTLCSSVLMRSRAGSSRPPHSSSTVAPCQIDDQTRGTIVKLHTNHPPPLPPPRADTIANPPQSPRTRPAPPRPPPARLGRAAPPSRQTRIRGPSCRRSPLGLSRVRVGG